MRKTMPIGKVYGGPPALMRLVVSWSGSCVCRTIRVDIRAVSHNHSELMLSSLKSRCLVSPFPQWGVTSPMQAELWFSGFLLQAHDWSPACRSAAGGTLQRIPVRVCLCGPPRAAQQGDHLRHICIHLHHMRERYPQYDTCAPATFQMSLPVCIVICDSFESAFAVFKSNILVKVIFNLHLMNSRSATACMHACAGAGVERHRAV